MNARAKERLRPMYGNCFDIEIKDFDNLLFEVCLNPLENGTRESFINDVRALLDKYFDGNYYDYTKNDDE